MIDHRTLAGIIESDTGYTGGPVRLLSCSAGALDEGIAQNLANKLGVEVIAPTDTLWIYKNGRLVIGPSPAVDTCVLASLLSWR